MIPILFAPGDTIFTNNGVGRLADAMRCDVSEVRNGLYELELEYPINGIHYEEIQISAIICAIPSDGSAPEPFRIYKITKPISGVVTVYAEHISYQLNYIPVLPYTAENCIDALNGLVTHAAESCPFTFYTDKQITGTWTNPEPASIRDRLGGSDGSILERFKGEYKFTGYDVWLYTNRGTDSGVTIRYGKNLTDLMQEENIENTYTGICPFWKSSDEDNPLIITLPEKVLHSENANNFPYQRTLPLDLSDRFDEEPTENELRAAAQAFLDANAIGVPDINISVSFMALWQTQEYAEFAPLERINLCDTLTVEFPALGVSARAKVIKTVYDTLTERYKTLEIGDAKSSLGETIAQISEQQTTAAITQAQTEFNTDITNAFDMFSGALGGHVVFNTNADGQVNEILIMDTDNKATAVNVIRANAAGIGFSQNGYNGPFNSAWRINGTFDASQINVIGLTASMIRGGILDLGSVSNVSGILRVYDEYNALIGQLDKNGLKMFGQDGSYVLLNNQVGFSGYDRNDNRIYWVDGQEFHQKKSVVEEEITLCGLMRFIPLTLYDGGGNITNEGIALVSAN